MQFLHPVAKNPSYATAPECCFVVKHFIAVFCRHFHQIELTYIICGCGLLVFLVSDQQNVND